jgi:hypothetical protein
MWSLDKGWQYKQYHITVQTGTLKENFHLLPIRLLKDSIAPWAKAHKSGHPLRLQHACHIKPWKKSGIER